MIERHQLDSHWIYPRLRDGQCIEVYVCICMHVSYVERVRQREDYCRVNLNYLYSV